MDGGGQTSPANQRQLSLRAPDRCRREQTSALPRSRGAAIGAGHPMAEITLLQGATTKKVEEKLD